ncbi:MAG: hypothetical protein ACYC6G_14045 [Desulfobaccales bacterium]
MTDKAIAKLEQELKKEKATRKRQEAKSRLLAEMSRHLGEANVIGAGDLFGIVMQRPHKGNKITGCRALRDLMEEVKYVDGVLIAFSRSPQKPGYYIPVGSEREKFFDNEDETIKRKIGNLARLKRVSAAAYAGQLALTMQEVQG